MAAQGKTNVSEETCEASAFVESRWPRGVISSCIVAEDITRTLRVIGTDGVSDLEDCI